MELKHFGGALLRACVAQSLFAASAYASQWTVTSYYAVVETTSTYSTYTEDWAVDTYTETITLKATAAASNTAEPTSTYVSEDTYYDVKIVEIYYDPTDIESSDIAPTSSYDYDDYYYGPTTYYYQDVFYTAPASCETAFTVKTYTYVYIPSEVRDQVTPYSVTTEISSYSDGDYTWVTAYLSEGYVAVTTQALTEDYVQTYYLDDCRNPTATDDSYYGEDGNSYSGDDDDSDDYYYGACYYYGCDSLRVWVIVVASVIPALFVIGFIESWFWFRRLMLGKAALRFGTITWVFLTLLILIFTRHSPARNAADRPALRQQWDAMSAGTRIKLWFKWGFRHAYPVELLGPDPKTFRDPKPVDASPPNGAPPMMFMGPPGPDGQPQMMMMGPPGPNGQPQMMMMGPPGPDGQPQVMMMPPLQMPPPVNGQPPMQYAPYGYPQFPMMNNQPPVDPNNPATYSQPQTYQQPQMYMQPPANTDSARDAPTPLETPSPLNTTVPLTTPSPVHTHTPISPQAPVIPAPNTDAHVPVTSAPDVPAESAPAVPHQQPPAPPANRDA